MSLNQAGDHRLPLLILYGSETGNAQDVAELIARESLRRHWRPRLLPADAYPITNLPEEQAVVFIVSTTGQGEPPNNITQLWKFLRRKSLGSDSLSNLSTAVFGLGNSCYLRYNVMGKLLYRRLQALGAVHVVPLGLGDDQHRSGYDAALDPWMEQLWKGLRMKFPLPDGPAQITEPPANDVSATLVPKYKVTYIENVLSSTGLSEYQAAVEAAAALEALDDAATTGFFTPQPATIGTTASNGKNSAAHAPSRQHPHFANVLSNERVTAKDHFQDVRVLDLDLEGSSVEFCPGDVIAVWPQQNADAVAAVCQRCGLDPEAWVAVESLQGHTDGVSNQFIARVGALLAGALDINSAVPRRVFFQALAQRALETEGVSQLHIDRLHHFASPLGRDDLHEYCRREGRTVLEVLIDFGSVNGMPLEWLLSFAPRLSPRRFSAASSLALLPASVQLLVAVVEWTTPGRRRRRGLCSSWLAGLEVASSAAKVALWAERGALKMPSDAATPLIMVGPGTGVAPFRSFIQQRFQEKRARSVQGAEDGGGVLFFGCRSAVSDYYFEEEWRTMSEAGVLRGPCNGIVTAFSRDQEKKVYVSDRIREHGADVWALLQSGASIYVSGRADKMPTDVAEAFKSVIVEHGGADGVVDADKYIRLMEAKGRYQVECWA